MIKTNELGKILKGEYKGWYVFVEVLGDEGDALIHILRKDEANNIWVEGYDSWVDSAESIQGYFEESEWEIEWGYGNVYPSN